MANKETSEAAAQKANGQSSAAAEDTTFTNGSAQATQSNGDAEAAAPAASSSSDSSKDNDASESTENLEAKAEALKNQGTAAYKEKSYAKAVEQYSAAIDVLPTYVPAIFNRAAAYMAQKRYTQALEDCQTAAALQGKPPQPKTLARLGKCQLALGLVDQASQTLQQAREAPGLENATLNGVLADLAKLDRIQNHLKNVQKAKDEKSWSMVQFGLDAVSKEVESEPLAWKLLRVEALIMRGKFDEASFLATNIVRCQPSNVGIAQIMSRIGMKQLTFDVPVLQPEGLFWRGIIFYQQGNWEQARVHFERALARDPDYKPLIPALKRLRAFDNKREAGKQAMAKKAYEEAVQCYTDALEIDPDNKQMQILLKSNRALAYNGLKRYEDAVADCEAVLALDSGHWKALRSRARAELAMEQYEAAVASFKEALESIEDGSERDQASVKSELARAEKELKKSKQKDYYKELGLDRRDNPDEADIKRAYKKASLKHHPDKSGGDDTKFKAIGEAYSVLSDPEKKARFDNGEDLDAPAGMPSGFEDMFAGGGGFGGFGGSPFGGGGFGGGGFGGADINMEDLFGAGARSSRRPF